MFATIWLKATWSRLLVSKWGCTGDDVKKMMEWWYDRMIHQNKIGMAPVFPLVDSLTQKLIELRQQILSETSPSLIQTEGGWCLRFVDAVKEGNALLRVLFCWVPIFFQEGGARNNLAFFLLKRRRHIGSSLREYAPQAVSAQAQ